MNQDESADAVSQLWQLSDVITPIAVRVAATLRLVDHIDEGHRTVHALANRVGAETGSLRRFVRFLDHIGVLAIDGDEVSVARLGETLRSDHPSTLAAWLDLDGFGGRMDRAIMELRQAVCTGGPVWELAHGLPFWQDLEANPDIARSFNNVMATGSAGASGTEIATRYDWSQVATVVDIGGGSGAMLLTIAEHHPHINGSVLELAGPASEAQAAFAEHGVADRLRAVSGSMFDCVPPGADVYMLVSVLHDWNDADAQKILANCCQAAGPGGRVLIVDGLLTEQNANVASMDLRMMLLVGGRERSADDYATLAATSGLEINFIQPLDAWNGASAMIECTPTTAGQQRRADQ